MKTPILGSSYVARSVNAADNRMVNLFPEIIPEGGKEPAFLQRAPGTSNFALVGAGPIRGMYSFERGSTQMLFVVSGSELYRVGTGGASNLIGAVANPGGGNNPVSFADDGIRVVMVTGGGGGYVFDTDTFVFTTITDVSFVALGPATVGYVNNRFVFGGNGPAGTGSSQTIICSELLNPAVFDPLDFSTVDSSPDAVLAVTVTNKEIWIQGPNSIEVWIDAGLPGFPLAPIPGAFNEVGCAARFSIAKLDNTLFWLGKDYNGQGIVYRAEGYGARRVSTHAIEWQIAQYVKDGGDLGATTAYTYQMNGHVFYVLVLQDADTTFVYDVATDAWHERAFWDGADFSRHKGNNGVFFNGKVYVGSYLTSEIFELSDDVYTDSDYPAMVAQRWLRSWRAIGTGLNTLRRSAHHSLQLDCESGVTGEVALRWSDDGGHTWSNPRVAQFGALPGTRVIWHRLGMTMKLRDRVYEVSGIDPNKVYIMGAELIAKLTNA